MLKRNENMFSQKLVHLKKKKKRKKPVHQKKKKLVHPCELSAEQLIISKRWKQPKCLSTEEWKTNHDLDKDGTLFGRKGE